MLYEDQVVDAVAMLLSSHGWTVESRAHAHQHGDDISASKDGRRLLVEAKGAGSSKPGTKRFGQPFTRNQVGSHIGVAVVRALRWASQEVACPSIALPNNPHHRDQVAAIAPALTQAGIGVFWVDDDGTVRTETPWEL